MLINGGLGFQFGNFQTAITLQFGARNLIPGGGEYLGVDDLRLRSMGAALTLSYIFR